MDLPNIHSSNQVLQIWKSATRRSAFLDFHKEQPSIGVEMPLLESLNLTSLEGMKFL